MMNLSLLFAASVGLSASPLPAHLSLMAPLVGHCWHGTLATGDPDTHCFSASGAEVRDHHEVLHDGARIYWGDTVYQWDDAAAVVRFTYADMTGGLERGTVHARGDMLDFGTSTYVGAKGERQQLTIEWRLIGTDAYDARNLSTAPPQTVRYRRAD